MRLTSRMREPDRLMGTEHKWVGWGYDTTICEHCRVDVYEPAMQYARQRGGALYCEDVPVEKAAYEEAERTKPARTRAALDKVRAVLSEEEYMLLNLRYFGEYRPRDYLFR